MPTDLKPELYLRLAVETEENLRTHSLDLWYPRAIDRETGGFHQNFDHDWKLMPATGRTLVYQSRLTWVAAQAAMFFPDEKERFEQYAFHGVKYLRDKMWDPVHGGFFWNIEGGPYAGEPKHTYGIAFAIYALSYVAKTMGDLEALELARKAFLWLEDCAYDAKNGGYFEPLQMDGTPILKGEGIDAIDTQMGLKSMNTHIHILEGFTTLYEVWPDPLLRHRLEETHKIVRDKVITPAGWQHMFFEHDWTPVGKEDSYGHDIETAFLITESAEALGMKDDPATWRAARALVDHTLAIGWDETYGGIYDEGSPNQSPTEGEGAFKGWWAQAEGLNSLLLTHEKYGAETDRYWNYFAREWEFIKQFQIDNEWGGWLRMVNRDGSRQEESQKSDAWTECYHQSRSMMNVTRRLRKLAN